MRLALAAAATAGLAQAPASAQKYASIVVDADTGAVLHARHADASRYPASLTKVMTLYMLFDEIEAGRLSMSSPLKVSAFAASQQPSKLGLRVGSTITVSDAIDSLVTKSANDVAVVVAEHIGGSERRFATLMTEKARTLGLKDTVFRNASGLPDRRQVTTARDMSILADRLMDDHSGFYFYFAAQKFRYGGKTYKTHNKLLGRVDGVDGIKTGYTRASGFNLMASAKRDGRRVIAVMLGGRTSNSRNTHVEALIEAAFDDAEPLRPNVLTASLSNAAPADPNAAAIPMLNGQPFVVAASTDADPSAGLSAVRVPNAAAGALKVASAPAPQATRRVTRIIRTVRTPSMSRPVSSAARTVPEPSGQGSAEARAFFPRKTASTEPAEAPPANEAAFAEAPASADSAAQSAPSAAGAGTEAPLSITAYEAAQVAKAQATQPARRIIRTARHFQPGS